MPAPNLRSNHHADGQQTNTNEEHFERRGSDCELYDGTARRFGSHELIPLWLAELDRPAPPAVIAAIQARAAHPTFGYPEPPPRLLQAICDFQARRYGLTEVSPDAVILTSSAISALRAALSMACKPGDEVVFMPPVYGHFLTSIETSGCTPLANPLRREGEQYEMDLEHLQSIITPRTRAIILCNPHNPTGRAWSSETLHKLAEIAQNHDLLIISDELHADLTFPKHRHTPALMASPDAPTFTITLLSPGKSFGITGLSAACALIPDPKLRARFQAALQHRRPAAPNVFGLVAMEAAYTQCDLWLDQLQEELATTAAAVIQFCKEHLPVLKITAPNATSLLWIDASAMGFPDEQSLENFLIHEAKVALKMGGDFGREGLGFLRMTSSAPLPKMMEALERIASSWQRRSESATQ